MDKASFDGNEISSGARGDEVAEPIGQDSPSGEVPPDATAGSDERGDPEETTEAPATFLERLDRRQNQVLRELDQLNARIEQVLEGFRRA